MQDGIYTGPTPRAGFPLVLMCGMAGQSLLFSVLVPALPPLAAELGPSGPSIAQFTFALASLGLILSGFAAGIIIDRFGPRLTIVAALACFAITGALPVLTVAPVPLLASRLLLGFATGIMSTTATLLLTTVYFGPARSRLIGYQVSTGSAVGLTALIAAGAVVAHADWHLSFLLYPLSILPFLLIAIVTVPAIRTERQPDGGPGAGATIALLWPIYLVAALIFMVPIGIGAELPFLLKIRTIVDPLVVSIVVAMTSVGSMTSGAAFGRLQAAIGARRTFALGLAVGAAGCLLIGIGSTSLVIGAGMFVAGVSVGLFTAYFWFAVAMVAPPELRARGLALLSSALFLGGFLFPLPFGALSFQFGLPGSFVAIAALLAAGAIGALIGRTGRILVN
ncbi:MFS transporter [Sphingobium sp. CFD-1]|uniref:MFS transporter n=1 Tax=Sphingobium sp. CFD-1 TaxID=2878545 RepID=UPI00214C6AAD|nr:MFS transporter [Sphingobium sp. CFD-1]